MRYRVFIYKKENGEKNLPFCPFWVLVTDFNKNISGIFDVPERVLL